MVSKRYDDDSRIKLFMRSAHNIMEKNYWETSIRPLGRSDLYSKWEVKIFYNTKQVMGSPPKMKDIELDYVLPAVRMFIMDSEEVNFTKVIQSAEALGVDEDVGSIAALRRSWEDICKPKFPFFVHEGKAVGMQIESDGDLIRWDDGKAKSGDLEVFRVSLFDVIDAYLNNKLLHPTEPHKRPKRSATREIVDALPEGLEKNLLVAASSGLVLVLTGLHNVLGSDSRWKCSRTCSERAILRRLQRKTQGAN
ncbi:hypothetical protein FCK90_08550 [Kocuria coralli]|uniref:Uncharacterized protein n=1 Tax=Kocuria coralli TaxID=1461025 RepID=A0A5J5KWL2_9MICC|nr:hypothetical protein [Kocuria coralli]KAA9394157.1 hypothetical protein FCK90_08550 [Kocuria coralli]